MTTTLRSEVMTLAADIEKRLQVNVESSTIRLVTQGKKVTSSRPWGKTIIMEGMHEEFRIQ